MSHTELVVEVPVVNRPADRLLDAASRHGMLGILLVLVAIDIVLQPALLSVFQAGLLIQGAMTLVLVAAAQTLVVMTGGLDLSVAGNLALANVLTATWTVTASGESRLWPVGVILLIGLVAGAASGSLVAYLGVPPFVATLATWAILNGVALLVMPNPGGAVSPRLNVLFNLYIGGIPSSVIMLMILIGLWYLVRTSRAGLHLRAVGGDLTRAHLNGINANRVLVGAYAGSGLLACAAGLYLASITHGGDPTIGDQFVLPSIIAVVVGGTWFGGQGGIGQTVIGALIITMMSDIIHTTGLSPNMSIVASSALLLLVVGTRQMAGRRAGSLS